MVRRLRKQFVTITMILVTVIFVVFFGARYVYESYWSRQDTLGLMEWIAYNQSISESVYENEVEENGMHPVYAVSVDNDNQIRAITASDKVFNKKKISRIVQRLISVENFESNNRYGSWLYCVNTTADKGKYIVLTDTSLKERDIRQILQSIGLIIAALAGIFCVSLYLSRFVTKPATRMIEREKQFVSDASHELKTPVAAIRVNAQALAAQDENNPLIHNILSETDRMSVLIKELLSFSYIEEKSGFVEKEVFELSECCEGIALSMESTAYEKRIHFNYSLEDNLKYTGNREQIRRLVVILLNNAIEHTPADGEIRFVLKTDNNRPLITVYNTGEGIEEKDLAHVFERFYRSEKGRSGDNNHYGLGLSIARSIVQSHRGTIEVKSEYGQYAEFTVIL